MKAPWATASPCDYGCAGILLHAKPGAVAYYPRLGFVPIGDGPGRTTTMFVPLKHCRLHGVPFRLEG